MSCPACGGPLAPWRLVSSAESTAPVPLERCGACRSAVTAVPALPGGHDSGAYASATPRLARLAGPILRCFDRRRLALLGPAGGRRLLDVGAGRGRFVATARLAGWDAHGIEPSARGVQSAGAVYGIELERATVEDAAIATGSLAAVTLWHVLEHLDDPHAALARIARWLEPGGLLLAGVPNVAGLQARIGGGRAYHLDVPRHRVHYTPAGLCRLLESAGFEPLNTTHVLLEHNPYGMWQSIVSRFTQRPSYLYNLLKRNAPLRSRDLLVTVALTPLAPIAALLELAAGLAGRGGTFAVLARRR